MASDFNRTVKEFAAALMPIVTPAVRGLLGILLALGMLVGFLTLMCAPQIQQRSGYDEAWEAFLARLERYERDASNVEGTGVHQRGSRVFVSGKIELVNEYELQTSEDVSSEYDLETQQLTRITIGREIVFNRKRDGPINGGSEGEQ